jgi:predicted enzyme related to lactoylglutathione lyase
VLALHDQPALGVVALEFGAADAATVHALHDKAVARGLDVRRAPAPITTPGGGFGFVMADHEGRVIRISTQVEQFAPLSDVNKPNKVSHIVLNSPDIERAFQFYAEMFGFVVSDRSEDQMVFIRCDNAHHNIAFNRNPYPSLNHVSFEMETFDAVMRGVGRLQNAGSPMKWGTGCHSVGNIMFSYFIDPNGFTIEYNFYVKPFDPETHEPQTHIRTRENMDAWGTAGLPSAEIRAAMAGPPPHTGE